MLTDGRTDGRTTDGRTTDARVTGILIAHLGAFGSGELIILVLYMQEILFLHMDLACFINPTLALAQYSRRNRSSLKKERKITHGNCPKNVKYFSLSVLK